LKIKKIQRVFGNTEARTQADNVREFIQQKNFDKRFQDVSILRKKSLDA